MGMLPATAEALAALHRDVRVAITEMATAGRKVAAIKLLRTVVGTDAEGRHRLELREAKLAVDSLVNDQTLLGVECALAWARAEHVRLTQRVAELEAKRDHLRAEARLAREGDLGALWAEVEDALAGATTDDSQEG